MLGILALGLEQSRASDRSETQSPSPGALDVTRAFYLPSYAFAGNVAKPTLARAKDLPVTFADFARYLASRANETFVRDYVFERLVERECRARRLAESAPDKAARMAQRRLRAGGASPVADPHGDRRRHLANEALLELRANALVRAERKPSQAAVRACFDDRYGVDGQRVRIRQIQITLPGTEARLASTKQTSELSVARAAEARARRLRAQIHTSTDFTRLLAESDDPTTQSLLARPEFRDQAGIVVDYNYQRYGVAFADAVRKLRVGEISAPVHTTHGWHLIELLQRKVTRLDDVRPELERTLLARPASTRELQRLREQLFAKYEVHFDA